MGPAAGRRDRARADAAFGGLAGGDRGTPGAAPGADLSAGVLPDDEEVEQSSPLVSLESELRHGDEPGAWATLHTLLPPELPSDLTPGQAAELAELLLYFHLRIRGLLETVQVLPRSEKVTLEQRQWQNLLDLQGRIAGYLRAIGEPPEGE